MMKESIFLVFTKPSYIFLSVLISFMIFFAFIFLTNYPLYLNAWQITQSFPIIYQVTQSVIDNILYSSGPLPLVLMIGIAIVAGINISMMIFKFRSARLFDKPNVGGLAGIIGSSFGVGCTACSVSLLSIIGVAGGLSVLPFKGLEITSIGLSVLLFSTYSISKSIYNCGACKVSTKSKK